MNILDIQDKLKNLSQDQLTQEMQSPTGSVPQFLVLSEINRRQSMRQSMQQQTAGSQTVAQELLNSAGVPAEGASDMAQSMAPKSSIAQNTGIGSLPQEAPPPETGGIASLAPQEQQPVGMAEGGVVKMYDGSQFRMPRPPNRSGLNITEEPYSYGSNSLGDLASGIGSFLSSDVNIDQSGNVSLDRPAEELPMDTGSPLAAVEMPPSPIEPAAPPVGITGTAGVTGSAGGGGGKLSSYEQMLVDAMNNADKKAKQDKWLALAQAGMALMSSTQPNLAGALGEAGNAGIAALQSSRDTAEQNKLKLAQELYGLQASKAAAARAGAPKPPSSAKIMDEISGIQKIIDSIGAVDPLTGGTISEADMATISELSNRRDALIGMLNQGSTGSADLSDIAQAAAAQ